MKSKRADDLIQSNKAWLWKTALLAGALGLGTYLLLSVLVPRRLPEDFPKQPDLQSQNAALDKLLKSAYEEARSHPKSAETIGRLAMVYHANQFFEQAEAAYKIAARLDLEDYRWIYGLALVMEETGQEKEVLGLLRKTLQRKKEYTPALQKLADIYFKRENLEEAARYYSLSVNTGEKGSSLQALFGLGRIAAKRKDWSKVIDYVAPLSRDYPQIRPLHQLLLDAYEALGQADKVSEERGHLLEPSLVVLPLVKDPLSETLLGMSCSSSRLLKEAGLLSRFRKPDEAIQMARRAVEVEPDDADTHHFLARTLLEAHGSNPESVDEALDHLDQGLRLRPGDPLPLWYFAAFFLKQEKTDRSVERLRAMLAANSHSTESHYYLGLVADRQGRTAEAAEQYQEALRNDPNNAEAHHKLGLIRATEGKLDEAIACFQNAVRLKPTLHLARCNLGVALDRKGRIHEAIDQLDEALRLQPNDATTHMFLASALLKSGKLPDATQHFREAVRITPGNAEAHYGLGYALALQRKTKEAADELQHTLRLQPGHADAREQLQRLERQNP